MWGCIGTRQNLCFHQLLPSILFVVTERIGRMIEFLCFTEDRFAQVIAARFEPPVFLELMVKPLLLIGPF